jgi:hypothetical protein
VLRSAETLLTSTPVPSYKPDLLHAPHILVGGTDSLEPTVYAVSRASSNRDKVENWVARSDSANGRKLRTSSCQLQSQKWVQHISISCATPHSRAAGCGAGNRSRGSAVKKGIVALHVIDSLPFSSHKNQRRTAGSHASCPHAHWPDEIHEQHTPWACSALPGEIERSTRLAQPTCSTFELVSCARRPTALFCTCLMCLLRAVTLNS